MSSADCSRRAISSANKSMHIFETLSITSGAFFYLQKSTYFKPVLVKGSLKCESDGVIFIKISKILPEIIFFFAPDRRKYEIDNNKFGTGDIGDKEII